MNTEKITAPVLSKKALILIDAHKSCRKVSSLQLMQFGHMIMLLEKGFSHVSWLEQANNFHFTSVED